jgi:hypothetical protein
MIRPTFTNHQFFLSPLWLDASPRVESKKGGSRAAKAADHFTSQAQLRLSLLCPRR